MPRCTRRETIAILATTGLSLSTTPADAQGDGSGGGEAGEHRGPTLNRLATTVLGAEITGMFITDDGNFFFNVQHPSDVNDEPFDTGTVGGLTGVNIHQLPLDFPSVQVPDTADEKHDVRTAVGEYQALANGGETTDDGELLGVPNSANGYPMAAGNNPDFNGFVPGESDDEGYLFTNWETRPGKVSRLHLRRSQRRGTVAEEWEVLESRNVDFRDVEGTWNNCFGTVSPWGTPLTSEEYEPNAAGWFGSGEGGADRMKQYLGEFANAYRYGYIVELADPTGDVTPRKHYAMGRFSHENSVVMPDERTVYMSDDGTGTVFFKFVADEAGDLSAGTLYAAEAVQDSGGDTATVGFDLEWIELAHATDDQVEEWIAEYDDQEDGSGADYVTDAEVERWAAGNAADDRAAFLESRKAAGAVGASTEFRKMEGVNIPPGAIPGDYMYMSMSAVNQTMADGTGDIQLASNDYGAVYRMELEENYDVSRMEPALTGGPNASICGGCPYDASPNSASSVCQDCDFNPKREVEEESTESTGLIGTQAMSSNSEVDPENTIANPDNLLVLPDGRVVIGEDSGLHENNMIWVYDPGPGQRAVSPVADGRIPMDPDRDRRFEDVDGNGETTYGDVTTLFDDFEGSSIRNHASAYDFNGNGRLDFDDVLSLFGLVNR